MLLFNLIDAYSKQLKKWNPGKIKNLGVDLIYLNYSDVLNNTESAISKIVSFVGVAMNEKKMANCVDKTFYRNKV